MRRFVIFGILLLGTIIAIFILYVQFSFELAKWGVTTYLPTRSAEMYITPEPSGTPTITPTVEDTPIATSTVTPTIVAPCIVHTIVEGENFILVARKFHIAEVKFMQDNPTASFAVGTEVLICKE